MGETFGQAMRQTRLLFQGGATGGLADRELLRRYADRGDETAFAALVERHGPMVLRACTAILGNPHDAHDAFQAAFLVLARKAGSLRVTDSLAPWLHEVARRVSACARSDAARRARHERIAAERSPRLAAPTEPNDLAPALHEEVGRLPERFRTAVLLCDFEGLTQEQAAERLGWPLGTVRSRLARGRDRLRGSLTRRGLAPPAVVPTLIPPPDATIAATARLASGDEIPLTIRLLADGGLRAMRLIRWKTTAVLTLALGLAASGAGMIAARSFGQAREPAKDEPPSAKTREAPNPAADFPGVNQVLVRVAPSRTKVWAFSPATHAWRTYRTSEGVKVGEFRFLKGAWQNGMEIVAPGGNPVGNVPTYPGVMANGPDDQVLAPILVGDEIREIVAFDVPTGEWVRQPLKEPARRACTPQDGRRFAIYRVGRYLYGFSAATGRWAVQALGEDADKDQHVGEAKATDKVVMRGDGGIIVNGRLLLHRPGEFLSIPSTAPHSEEYSGLIRVGRFVCGLSVPKGTWDVLDLGVDDNDFPYNKNQMTMDAGGTTNLVPRGDHLYHFNAATGKFQDIEADEPPAAGTPK